MFYISLKMANREMFIMFVYDTQRCVREEDDPNDAILYFHPGWVCENQRVSLCGQLMGAVSFFQRIFSCPRIIALNSGKFIMQHYGRYILTVGTDRNIPDWVLQHRADTLHHLIQFYHRDLETVSLSVGSDPLQFIDKLKQMFETYLPILPYAANMFGNIPMIRLPKSASNIFLQATQILQTFCTRDGVLGGVVLFQNKVVTSQLSSELTKRLVSSDPCRIKSPAEPVSLPFHLPVGVQLVQVYVESKEFYKLQRTSAAARSSIENVANRKSAQRKVQPARTPGPKDQLTAMKRDISRIFTVPEEKEGETEQTDDCTFQYEGGTSGFVSSDISASKVSESSTYLSSDCPTPIREINLNKILHAKVMSICSQSKDDELDAQMTRDTKTELSIKLQEIANSKDIPTEKSKRKRSKRSSFLVNYYEGDTRSLSLNDLQQNPRMTSNRVPMRYYSFGLPRVTSDMTDDNSDYSPVRNVPVGKYFYNTISDPLNPVFRHDGLPMSRSLHNDYLAQHYQYLDRDLSNESSPGDYVSKVSFTDITSQPTQTAGITESEATETGAQKHEQDRNEPQEVQAEKELDEGQTSPIEKPEKSEVMSSKQEVYRRSLSLPLKTMTNDYEDEEMRKRSTSYTAGVVESPAVRMKTLGLQLTPLMSKLSVLAMEDKTSGFCSRDTTPGEFRDLSFPSTSYASSSAEQTKKKEETERREADFEQEENGENNGNLKHAVLYLFGQQNMTLILLLEEGLSQDPDLIHYLWETSMSSLNKLELHLRHCLEHFPQTEGTESYSFMCVDPNWDMIQRGGTWASSELEVVACMHNDFTCQPSLTEIVVRCEESTVYGYHCGKYEIFYQQPTGNTTGLPAPSDIMGVVPLKARRRLERDHSIVLL